MLRRSKIRIEAGRGMYGLTVMPYSACSVYSLSTSFFILFIFSQAKLIDLLAKYANTLEDDMDVEMQEPYHLLRGLNIVDLEDLMEDINV